MTNYTIIGYRSDSVGSEFEFQSFRNPEDAAEYYAKLYTAPIYNSWEITILFDGLEGRDFKFDPESDWAEIPGNEGIIQQFDVITGAKIKNIEQERIRAKIQKAERAASEKERIHLKRIHQQEVDEQILLEKLTKKYKGSGS